jgi:electron transfer flavoprotein alpha subunit
VQVLVAVKWVPAPESVAFDPVLNRINRTGVAGMLNPLDWGAIDTALTLRRERGGRVTAVTMGPPEAGAGLRVALAAGVDAGIHLCDPAFAGADTLATSRVLAEVFRATSADLFLFGANTIDGGTAQTAAQVAAITGAAVLTEAWEVTPTAGGVAVMRHCDGNVERWSVPFPAVVSVARRPAPPETEPADIAGRIEQWDAERLGLDIRLVGIRGSATYVQKITPVAVYRAGRAADPVTAAQQVATLLRPALPSSNAPTRARVCTPTGCSLWALVEVVGDRVHRSSLEGLGCLRSVAGAFDAEVVSVAFEHPGDLLIAQLAAAGADRVVVGTAPGLRHKHPQEAAAALAALVRQERPSAVLGPWSAWGRQCLAMAVAELEAGLTGDFVGLDVSPRPGDSSLIDLVWLKPAWSGTALARVVARTTPAFGTLRPCASRLLPGEGRHDIPVQTVPVPTTARPKLLAELTAADVGDGTLAAVETAECVIAVGSTVDRATLRAAESWAAEHGWALCGTRRAVQTGTVPAHRELSLAVRSVSPRVFVGVCLDEPSDVVVVRGAELVTIVAPATGLADHEYDIQVTGGLADLLAELTPLLSRRPAPTFA